MTWITINTRNTEFFQSEQQIKDLYDKIIEALDIYYGGADYDEYKYWQFFDDINLLEIRDWNSFSDKFVEELNGDIDAHDLYEFGKEYFYYFQEVCLSATSNEESEILEEEEPEPPSPKYEDIENTPPDYTEKPTYMHFPPPYEL